MKLGWPDNILWSKYYKGLASQIKNALLNKPKPWMLAELCSAVININYRYWECHWEQIYENSHYKGKFVLASSNTFTLAKSTPSTLASKSNNNNSHIRKSTMCLNTLKCPETDFSSISVFRHTLKKAYFSRFQYVLALCTFPDTEIL